MVDTSARYIAALELAKALEVQGKIQKAIVALNRARGLTTDQEECYYINVWKSRLARQVAGCSKPSP